MQQYVGLYEISTTMVGLNPMAKKKARNRKSILIKNYQMSVVHNIFNTFAIITKSKNYFEFLEISINLIFKSVKN